MLEIDKHSPFTLTYQLTSILRANILNDKYSEGSLIPTENDLIKTYKVSRITVRKALDNLVQEGLLRRERGRGTFVNKRDETGERSLLISATSTFQAVGIQSEIKLIGIEKIVPSQMITLKLGLRDKDIVFKLERLRLGDNVPLFHEVHYLPEALYPDLDKLDLETSLYEIMNKRYHIKPIGAHEIFTAIKLDKEMAEILGCKEDDPGFAQFSVIYRVGRIPSSVEEVTYRGDQFKIRVEVAAEKPRGAQFTEV